MAWINNNIPPVSPASGGSGSDAPKPTTPPPAPMKSFASTQAMSDYMHGPLSNWLAQNAASFPPSTLSGFQQQINAASSKLLEPNTASKEGIDAFNEIMSQLGFPTSDAEKALQLNTAAQSIDKQTQKQLFPMQKKVEQQNTQVVQLRSEVEQSTQGRAAAAPMAEVEEIMERVQGQMNGLQQLAGGISDAAAAIGSMTGKMLGAADPEGLEEINSNFSNLTSMQGDFTDSMQNALSVMTADLAKVQGIIKTDIHPILKDLTLPSTALFNAMSNLWSLMKLRSFPQDNPQDMALLAQVIQGLDSQLSSDPGGSDPASSQVYQILNSPIPGTNTTPPTTLASICGTSASPNASAVQGLLDNYNFGLFNGNVTIGGQSMSLLSWLSSECNSSTNWWQEEYYGTSPPTTPPYPAAPTSVINDYQALQTAMKELNGLSPGEPLYNAAVQQVATAMNALISSLSPPTNGYTQFLYSYFTAMPLDGTNTFATLATGAASGNASDISALANFLSNSTLNQDLTSGIGNNIFNNIDPNGPNPWWPPAGNN